MAEPITIKGLSQFRRNLRKIDGDLPKMVRLVNNEAADLVIGDARPRVPSRTGAARRSLRKASTGDKVRARAGGNRARHYPWLDYGGEITRGGRGTVKRPFYKDGRYIYRSYYQMRDSGKIQKVMTDGLLGIVRAAGIEVD